MIRYALGCDKGHAFESWFRDSAAYDKQAKRGLVTCPHCGSSRIEKQLMAPSVATSERREAAAEPAPRAQVAMAGAEAQEMRRLLKQLRDHVKANADDVGADFPELARKMHFDEIEKRSIYGEASLEEAKSLIDDGVDVHPLPMLPDDRN